MVRTTSTLRVLTTSHGVCCAAIGEAGEAVFGTSTPRRAVVQLLRNYTNPVPLLAAVRGGTPTSSRAYAWMLSASSLEVMLFSGGVDSSNRSVGWLVLEAGAWHDLRAGSVQLAHAPPPKPARKSPWAQVLYSQALNISAHQQEAAAAAAAGAASAAAGVSGSGVVALAQAYQPTAAAIAANVSVHLRRVSAAGLWAALSLAPVGSSARTAPAFYTLRYNTSTCVAASAAPQSRSDVARVRVTTCNISAVEQRVYVHRSQPNGVQLRMGPLAARAAPRGLLMLCAVTACTVPRVPSFGPAECSADAPRAMTHCRRLRRPRSAYAWGLCPVARARHCLWMLSRESAPCGPRSQRGPAPHGTGQTLPYLNSELVTARTLTPTATRSAWTPRAACC